MKTLIGCCLIHLCIGCVYATSVLYTPLLDRVPWELSTLVYGFAMTILALGLTASIHQQLFHGYPRRTTLYIGVALWITAQSLALLSAICGLVYPYYVCMLLLGIAIGILYVVPINIITDYGFNHVGRASGAVVCCFGVGSVVASKLYTLVPLDSLPAMYGLYTLVMLIGIKLVDCIDIIQLPARFQRDKLWYKLAGIFFLNIGIGISLLSNLVQLSIVEGLDLESAVVLVALAGVVNSVGRLVYSSMSDYMGRINTLSCILWIQLVSLVCILVWELWTLPVLIIVSVYGGVFAIMPSLMKEQYQLTTPYSQVLAMWGFAGLLCPIVFSWIGLPWLLFLSIGTLILVHNL